MALNERALPLERPEVQKLVRQAVYQLGTLNCGSNNGPPKLLWRTDWLGSGSAAGDLLLTLCHELDGLAEQLVQAPREHEQVLLLGELASFFSDWHAPFCEVARHFAAMTARAAEDIQLQMDASSQLQEDGGLLSRQCFLRMASLLCYKCGPLVPDDVGKMARLLVQINHGYIFVEDPAWRQKLSGLKVLCHNLMASCIHEVVSTVKFHTAMLTVAVSSVLQRLPTSLKWEQVMLAARESASFQAECQGHVYSINLLDGTVLLDGSPPGRLPKDILAHALYKRSFGDNNFRVTVTSAGVLQTLRPINGRFYDFSFGQARQLFVVEVDKDAGVEL